jgi:hypothetical protein
MNSSKLFIVYPKVRRITSKEYLNLPGVTIRFDGENETGCGKNHPKVKYLLTPNGGES